MPSLKYYIPVFIQIALLLTSPSHGSDGWRFEYTRDGITVSTRAVETSPLREFRAVGDISASMEDIEKVLVDTPSLTKWQPDCIQARLLSTEDNGRILITYNETKAPWPVSNRDVVTRSVITITKDSITHEISALDRPDLIPLAEGKVRITDMNARWVLTRNGTSTGVLFQARANPGGAIPTWVVNKFSTENPYKTLANLRRMLAR